MSELETVEYIDGVRYYKVDYVKSLQNKLHKFENTGMIGSSPAQFLDRITKLEKEVKELEEIIFSTETGEG